MSIVVPVYNVEKYLRQCLDSLVQQTLKNIEIIVVNDCSPDNSEAIILEYAARDDRIVYIKHEENKGLGGARNTGIRAARGEYIAFIDSDDYVDVTLYEAAVRAFEEHEIDILCMPFQKFDEKGNIESFYRPHDEVYTVNLDEMLLYSFFNAWSKIYRRADIEKHGFIFPEHMYWEDVPFWMQYCATMQPRVWNLSDGYGFYWYRGRFESITGQGHVNYKSVPDIFSFVYADLGRRGLMNSEVFFSFYKIVMQTLLGAWNLLEKKYKAELSENFFAFTRKISFGTAERRIAPVWHQMSKIPSPGRRRLFMHGLMRRLNLKAKIKHIIHHMVNLSPWGGGRKPASKHHHSRL